MTNYNKAFDQLKEAMVKMNKIEAFVESYNRQMITKDRFVMLITSVMKKEEEHA
ncbi:hypothetical protein [Streptococcus merionis]|uniref:hypothetical protein n=1 Tax=Streptococcus merionis TaxID=400065 RepID=UPI003515DE45